MPAIETPDGLRLWYQDRGGRRAPTVLALHGFTGSHRTFRGGWPVVAAAGRRLVVPDLYGHGRSPAPAAAARLHLDHIADDLMRLPLPPSFDLLGYSMGARLALWVAIRHPERVSSLVLESGSPGLEDESERALRRAQDERWATLLETEGLAAFVRRWENQPLFATQKRLPGPVRRRLRRERRSQAPAGLAASLRGSGTGSQPSLWPCLDRLRMPVLLVAGREDAKYVGVARQMAKRLRRVEVCVVDGAGHTPHLERPNVFWEAVERFWRDSARSG